MSQATTYNHSQKSPWSLFLYLCAATFFSVAWVVPNVPLRIVHSLFGAIMLLLAESFRYLAVSDRGDRLAVRFGPLPLFQRHVRYADICTFKPGRTTLLDGWGIHWSPWGGWLWNIWGRDCIIIRLDRRTFRVGTDDPAGLAELLRAKGVAEDDA